MWNKLTESDLRLVLSQDEIERISTLSLDPSLKTVVQDSLDMAADAFRGAFAGKGFTMDVREHYIPASYRHWVLVYARQICWTRFPMSPNYAMDDLRKEEQKTALQMLKDPCVGTETPDWEHSSKNPENGKIKNGTITLPPLRFDSDLFHYHNLSIDLI